MQYDENKSVFIIFRKFVNVSCLSLRLSATTIMADTRLENVFHNYSINYVREKDKPKF